MTIQQLHYAIVIAEAGSLNKAAERLYVSQPSLTNAMQELEKELNITIFHRSGRGVTLTPEGADFMLYARQVVHQYEDLLDRYGKGQGMKKKFGVSTQHYSFAVKAFVELVKQYDSTNSLSAKPKRGM
jgi:DNA-binding transcriptional LysR family regulator